MKVFDPNPRNNKPIIAKLVDNLKESPYGSEYTYEQLTVLADGEDLKSNRNILHSVANKLSRYYDRCLVNIRGQGYKILQHKEVAEHSRLIRKQAHRKFKKAERAQNTVDLSGLSEDERTQIVNEKIKTAIYLTVYKAGENKKQLKGTQLSLPDESQIINLILKKGKEFDSL